MSDGIKGLHQGTPHFVGPGEDGIAPSLDTELRVGTLPNTYGRTDPPHAAEMATLFTMGMGKWTLMVWV